MSKPLSEEQRRLNNARTRAVNQAKRDEVALIKEGKGTRDWTPAQQKEWIQTGKCEGFKGHHMKDVSTYPEYAGDRHNIQMLNAEEHLKAHGGNFRNSTNGYYNPDTGRFRSFGNNPPSKPKAQDLSNPISERAVKYNETMRKNAEAQKSEARKLKAEGSTERASKARAPEKHAAPEKTDSKTLEKSRAAAAAPESASTQSKTLAKDRARATASESSATGRTHAHKKTHSH